YPAQARTNVQRTLQAMINRTPEGELPPRLCEQDDANFNDPFDAHHTQPLFLNGEEHWDNVCALRADYHQRGHPELNNQHEMLNDATWIACKVCEGNLLNHPAGQEYEIEGTK
ncbi:MAG: hypothetical protein ABIZ80_13205, partial [Bryobacteraceae bacterium]